MLKNLVYSKATNIYAMQISTYDDGMYFITGKFSKMGDSTQKHFNISKHIHST